MTKKEDQFEELKTRLADFLKERNWTSYHTPKNIAMSIAIEAAELMELFQWHNITKEEAKANNTLLGKISDELADIMIYCLSMGLSLDIDLFKCITLKMDKNNKRFPPKEEN
jgi:NTP pyrophosphatase (non-canonical NTP hydrolase)